MDQQLTWQPENFLWGAATAGHQTEGNNVSSDWWARELKSNRGEPSGDTCDSYHRYPEDMQLLADAGLTSYRFSIEWARIEPVRGRVSKAQLAHYRRMIDMAKSLGLEPVVTLHHFTSPLWFTEAGGFDSEDALDCFLAYLDAVAPILSDVKWIITMNEPNMLALIATWAALGSGAPTAGTATVMPDTSIGQRLVEVHHAARLKLRELLPQAKIGWAVACQALTPSSGASEERYLEVRYIWEDLYLDASIGDDFVGVQSYTSSEVDEVGIVPAPEHPDNTQMGGAYRPDALGIALRHAWERTKHVPILVTENGIATDDDNRRIEYTRGALEGLRDAMADGIDVRGYLHWSLLDNYEWGSYHAKFGLIAVDRESFKRTPKPSLNWLGNVARKGLI